MRPGETGVRIEPGLRARLSRAEALTFDCYGTLIDWESGILAGLGPVLRRRGVKVPAERLLEMYAAAETAVERGPYVPYRRVLRRVMGLLARRLCLKLTPGEERALELSLGRWKPFPDAVGALRRLKRRYRLCVVSNVDDDLFRASARRLKVRFECVVTAEQVRSYKPRPGHFRAALRALDLPKERVLHVAQSLFHDVAPAKSLGWTACWVNRRHGKRGFGATMPGRAAPDLEVPDLAALARLLNC